MICIYELNYKNLNIDKEAFIEKLEDRGYSTVREIFSYLGDDIKEILYECRDIYQHGIQAGFGSFIYYSDTVKFYKDNEEEILDNLKELANSMYGDNETSLVTLLYENEIFRIYLEEMIFGSPERLYNEFTWIYVQGIINSIMEEDEYILLDCSTLLDCE